MANKYEMDRIQRRIDELSALMPTPEANPSEYRRIADEITMLCDAKHYFRLEPYRRNVI